jgi:hypothetical protein
MGEQPLANNFLTEEKLTRTEFRFPLSVNYCKSCGLTQLLHVVNPELLYLNYAYFSSASQPLVEHFSSVASDVIETYQLSPDDLVCEIGSNDGVFLRNFLDKTRVIGVDPAKNIAAIATAQGIPTIADFFNQEVAERTCGQLGKAKLIFAANVFASIDDLEEVMKGICSLLDDDGVLILEVHRFADMLQSKCFDQIYHEHLCFFTLRPLALLMERFQLRIIDVTKVPVHGESFQIHVARQQSSLGTRETVAKIRKEEVLLGLDDVQTYFSFAKEIEELRSRIHGMLTNIKSQGKRIAGYGAPGKGNILLNYAGIGNTTIDYLVDTTPHKQGLFTPGLHIPIFPPEKLHEDRPDYILILSWNYANYILNKEQELIDQGTKFIIPIPEPTIVDRN